MKRSIIILCTALSLGLSGVQAQEQEQAQAQAEPQPKQAPALSVDELLEKVKQGHRRDQSMNAERLETFRQQRSQQSQLLQQIKAERTEQESISTARENQFEQNERDILLLQERLSERLGSLKELFGVLQLVANDTQGQFDNSLVQLHYPERSARLNEFSQKMGQTTELPTVGEIEALWFELQREMTESGKIVRFNHTVLTNEGDERSEEITRIGAFNLAGSGRYLQRISETGRVVEYPRQPSRRYMDGVGDLDDAKPGELLAFTVDPIRGQLIALKGASPDLGERIQQGGVIGYVILSLGAVVVLLAIGRFAYLWLQDQRIQSQLSQLSKPGDNPLGRIIQVYQDNKDEDMDSLELKMGEAVLREVPRINTGLSFLKISAALAPLLGLLGTVTGMIITFQAITLFGAGDPKLMAGGISQALVTTVLGLTVAIPTLLLHNIVNSKATKLSQIIEQEAVALVATQAQGEA